MTSATQNLEQFVHKALERGLPKTDIEQSLRQAGWSAGQIKSALNQFADLAFPIPVPRPRPYLSPREAFRYLLLFTALYLSAFYLGSLLFNFVDLAFPDPAMSRYWIDNDIRWAASFLIIAYPVFLFMSYRIRRDLTRSSDKHLSLIRRWLTYMTLFVAACFVIGDLVTLVYNALGGELTIRFSLKILIVGAIAGTIFGFYLWDLRGEDHEAGGHFAGVKWLALCVSAVVIAALAGAFFALGSPGHQRSLRLDERRMNDLGQLSARIERHAKSQGALPPELSVLESGDVFPIPADPDTDAPYEYKLVDANHYQLCAVFALPSADDNRQQYGDRRHAAGKQCFTYTWPERDRN